VRLLEATQTAPAVVASLQQGNIMSVILFIIFGFVVGLLARALLPGRQSMGIVATTLLGILGSFVGGFLVSFVTHNRITDFNMAGLVGSVVGAILVLIIANRFSRRGALA
jgi:uncharacterized membrane protein YeaQ/YmgE (transglycosylase-associated protein family)